MTIFTMVELHFLHELEKHHKWYNTNTVKVESYTLKYANYNRKQFDKQMSNYLWIDSVEFFDLIE